MSAVRRLAMLLLLALVALGAMPRLAAAQDSGADTRPPLRWGADPSGGAPFAFFDPNDPERVIGFEVDIMEEVARRLGRRLELHRADWLALYDSLESGRCDMLMNGFEVTEERAAVARFGVPYFAFGQQIVVRAGDASQVKGLDDLAGRRVAVLNGSASVDVLKEAGFADERILQYDDSLAPYTEVALGRADAALAESIIAAYYAGADARLRIVPGTFSPGTYAAVTRSDDPALAEELDRTLRAMQADGTLGEILQAWGLWDAAQEALGTVKGRATPVKAEARGGASAGDGERDAGGGSRAAIALAILKGAWVTVLLTLLAMPVATVAGFALSVARLSPRALIARPAQLYVTLVRGTPLLVQIFLVYFSLPPLGQWIYAHAPGFLQGALDLAGGAAFLTLPPFLVGVGCLAANYAAYEAEVHRGGLEAVPAVQWDAARVLGLSRWQTIRHVVAPQSLRVAMPGIVNDLNSLIKDSCLVSVIGVTDLLGVALGIGKSRFTVPEMLVIAGVVYLVLSVAGDLFGAWIERRMRARGFASAPMRAAGARGAHA